MSDSQQFCVAGYSTVAFDGASNYSHTPPHHSSQFSNHFKHEEALMQQSSMGKSLQEHLCTSVNYNYNYNPPHNYNI